MSWLFDDPTTVLVAGLLIQVLLGVVVYQTGRWAVLWANVGVLALMLLCVLIELVVVTDEERIADTLDRVAAALETNDLPTVLAFLDPNAGDIRASAESILPTIVIESASVSGVEVQVAPGGETATARLFAKVSGNDKAGLFGRENYVKQFEITLRKAETGWLLTGYRDAPRRNVPDAE